MENSQAPRFRAYREGIAASRAPSAEIAAADRQIREIKDRTKANRKGLTAAEQAHARALKNDSAFKMELAAAERHFKRLKGDLFGPFRLAWRGPHREWLDVAVVLTANGAPKWPSLLGTGGNDGRLDFTNNAMQRLGQIFDLASVAGVARVGADRLLRNALRGTPAPNLVEAAVGQFLPGTGGANSGTGFDGVTQVNPWDFVLMMEGSILFSARSTRRLDPQADSLASAPFAVRAHHAGSATAGQEKSERGEQWMPLWDTPTTLVSLQTMLGEARVQLGRVVSSRPLEFARAVARLGVARGLSSFVRYGYLERNGQSKIAVPLGRVAVQARVDSRLLDEIAPWLDRLDRVVRDGAPGELAIQERFIGDAAFAAVTHDHSPGRWQAVLVAGARLEATMARGTGFAAGPMPRLSSARLAVCDDGSPEWRLACALGSAAARYRRDGRAVDPVRAHFVPLDRAMRRFATTAEKRIARDPRVVATGRDAFADCIHVVGRRLVESSQHGQRSLPLVAARGMGARLSDLAELVAGRVDLDRTVWLARALMAMRWSDSLPAFRLDASTAGRSQPEEPWLALRLATLPFALDDRHIPVDSAVVRRLSSGNATEAVGLALRRLRASGFRPPLSVGVADAATARRWAAALAFPIDHRVASAIASRFENHMSKETR